MLNRRNTAESRSLTALSIIIVQELGFFLQLLLERILLIFLPFLALIALAGLPGLLVGSSPERAQDRSSTGDSLRPLDE